MVIRPLVPPTLLAALSLLACESSEPAVTPPPEPEPVLPAGLDERALFVRASLDVRGIRPTAEELALLRDDPSALAALLDTLVEDPRLGDRVGGIYAEAVRTRKDQYFFGAVEYGLDPSANPVLQHAISEEPVHLVRYVTATDAPFSEILTADYTVVDSILFDVWPLEELADQPAELEPGTVMAHYVDGRPSAGLLAQNAFYWRHRSTVENANRGRTNAISRAFLCEDYLDRPIDFPKDVNLTDSESIQNAIKTNQACQACHATIDPVASHLWGFMHPSDDPFTWSLYHPDAEHQWKNVTQATPAFFGSPTSGRLDSLAAAIAGDGRFVNCAVERVYEAFLGREAAIADEGQLAAHREAFLASGLSMRALVRSLLDDPAYRGIAAESAFGGEPEPVELKLVSPEMLMTSLYDLSGYLMTFDGRPAARLDSAVRAFGGGSDRGAVRSASLGGVLVHRRLAEAAARAIVSGVTPDSRVGALLAAEDLSAAPSAEAIAALVLEIRSLEVPSDGEEVASLRALWDEAFADTGDPSEAWTALCTALFADPELAVY